MTMILQSNQSTSTVNTKKPNANLTLLFQAIPSKTVCSDPYGPELRFQMGIAWSVSECATKLVRPDTSGLNQIFTIPDLLP